MLQMLHYLIRCGNLSPWHQSQYNSIILNIILLMLALPGALYVIVATVLVKTKGSCSFVVNVGCDPTKNCFYIPYQKLRSLCLCEWIELNSYMFVKTISKTDKQFMEINVYFTKREFKWKYNFRKILLVTQKRGVWVVLSSAVNAQLWHFANEQLEEHSNTQDSETRKWEFVLLLRLFPWFGFCF